MMASGRQNQSKLSMELEYHIASNWAHFRRPPELAPGTTLDSPVFRLTEGPFWGKPLSSVPTWYIEYLCWGGENFLLWKDQALSLALSSMKYEKVKPAEASILPPLSGLSSPSRSATPQYATLAHVARNAPDSGCLLKPNDIRKANTRDPGLHMQSEIDRSRSYDADMKRKLFSFRNDPSRTYDKKSW